MSIFEVGRMCIKKVGRETGKKCVIVETVDKNYVLITGPRELTAVKRRRVNVDHLEPLDIKLSIKKGAEDKEIAKVLNKTLPEEFPPIKVEEKPEIKAEQVEKPVRPRKKRVKKEEKKKTKEKSQDE